MLKGQVFSRQLFENQIFALFINTFLNGNNGVSNNYANSMAMTYSGNNVTIDSGAVCIQGRFLEEDTSTTISAGTDAAYCKLVIEIDLDVQNTESTFNQGAYKIIKGTNSYPALTQQDIVKNNAGIYQYELARFQNSANGITNFQDKRTYLDFESIYDEIWQHIQDIDDGSLYVQKAGDTMTGALTNASGFIGNASTASKLQNARKISLSGAISGNANFDGSGNITITTTQANIAVIEGTMTLDANTSELLEQDKWKTTVKSISYPAGYNKSNSVVIAFGTIPDSYYDTRGYSFQSLCDTDSVSLAYMIGANPKNVALQTDNIRVWIGNIATESKTVRYKIVLMKIS